MSARGWHLGQRHQRARQGRQGKSRAARTTRTRYQLPPDNHRKPDHELLADLRAVARKMRTRVLTTTLYRAHGRFDRSTIISRFGSWNAAVARAGLCTRWHRYSVEELMLNIVDVWDGLGRPPVRDDLSRAPSRISATPYQSRFGRFRDALDVFVRWAASPQGQRAMACRRRCRSRSKNDRRETVRSTGSRANPRRAALPRRCRVRRITVSRRFAVLKRDRFRCRACGRSPASDAGVELQVDHIRPIARGGSDALANLQTLCKQCNYGKGARRQ